MPKWMSKGLIAVALFALITGGAYLLYAGNAAPAVPPIAPADAVDHARPYVVKLHAQWCPVCMLTKDVWQRIADTYGARVNLVVFDFTTEAHTAASKAQAAQLGLEALFEEYEGVTGTILVLDPRTRAVTAEIKSRDFAEHRAAIDAILRAVP